MKALTDTEYIHALIAQGEHRSQDFKFEISDARKIAKTLSAFANTGGGRLLIGVKDNGRIAGVRSAEEQYMIEAAATLYLRPGVTCRMQTYVAEGRSVLVAEVDESDRKPVCAIDASGKPLAYLRVADETVLATPVHLCVWRQAGNPQGELIEMGEREHHLLRLLKDHPHLTPGRYARLAGIPRRDTLYLLAKLVRYGVIELVHDGKGFRIELISE